MSHFQINGNDIDIAKETESLGLLIGDNLKWESNVKYAQYKISRAIGFLKYAKHYVQENTLRNMHLSIVQPHFNFCRFVRGMIRGNQTENLAKITEQSCQNCYRLLLQRLGRQSLENLINRESCTMVYKSLNNLTPENLGNLFYKLSNAHARVLRNTKCNLAVPTMRKAYGQKAFAFRGAKAWSKLETELRLAPLIESKTNLKALN